jgi:small-conductance mechanosensitive channel
MDGLLDYVATRGLIGSAALVLVVLALRFLLIRAIRGRSDILSQEQRRRITAIKSMALFAIAVGLVLIWASQLQTLALSLAAFAVAIVLATKELVLCVSGTLLRASSRAFQVGDWIEVAGLRGEVIDRNVFATTIEEIGCGPCGHEYTGRTVTIPNSLFLTHGVRNDNFLKRYVYHQFSVTVEPVADVAAAKAFLVQRAEAWCAPFMALARRYIARIERKAGVDIPDPEPRVRLTTTDAGRYVFTATVFCPTKEAIAIEQRIIEDFLAFVRTGPAGTADGDATALADAAVARLRPA